MKHTHTLTHTQKKGISYQADPVAMPCPDFQLECPVQQWVDFVSSLNPIPGPGDGCCVVGPGFVDLGCDRYEDPSVLNVEECRRYREWCPHVACGNSHVLDQATMMCRRRA